METWRCSVIDFLFQVGPEKYLRGKIVKIHPLEQDETGAEKKSGSCDSPSSDKENSSQVVEDDQKEETTRLDSLSALRESKDPLIFLQCSISIQCVQ